MLTDLNELYKGKATIIKNKQYLSAKDYVSPFVERFKDITDKFFYIAKPADQISCDKNTADLVYNKVLIFAVLPELYDMNINYITYHRVICMSYCLDIKTPLYKFYTGVIDPDFTFFSFGINNSTALQVEPETALDYSFVKVLIDNCKNDQCKAMLIQIQDLVIDKKDIFTILGSWIDFTINQEYFDGIGKTKLSSNMAINAYKTLVLDRESDLYSSKDSIPLIDAIKAWNVQIKEDDKDIISRYEKTQLVNRLFNL